MLGDRKVSQRGRRKSDEDRERPEEIGSGQRKGGLGRKSTADGDKPNQISKEGELSVVSSEGRRKIARRSKREKSHYFSHQS